MTKLKARNNSIHNKDHMPEVHKAAHYMQVSEDERGGGGGGGGSRTEEVNVAGGGHPSCGAIMGGCLPT